MHSEIEQITVPALQSDIVIQDQALARRAQTQCAQVVQQPLVHALNVSGLMDCAHLRILVPARRTIITMLLHLV